MPRIKNYEITRCDKYKRIREETTEFVRNGKNEYKGNMKKITEQ